MAPALWLLTTCSLLISLVSAQYYASPNFANFTYAQDAPIVDVGYTKLIGTTMTSASFKVNAYLGVRYALNPTGDNRFKEPVAAETQSWIALTDAYTFGPICFQVYSKGQDPASVEPFLNLGGREPDEDCLLMDIFAPDKVMESGGRVPVYVVFHGGAYMNGASTETPPSGFMSAAPNGFVMINVQYRLGAFGFLAGDAVYSNGWLNAGLLDQRQALNWIQRHIAAFGGDPEQIVIGGPSAGGSSVAFHLTWDGGISAKPPFARAIVEFPYFPQLPGKDAQNSQYQALLDASKCANIDCLRAVDVATLASAQQTTINNALTKRAGAYGPVIDGVHVREYLSASADESHFNAVPLFVTHDGNEGASFAPQSIRSKADFDAYVRSRYPDAGDDFYSTVDNLYPGTLPGQYGYTNYQGALNLLVGDTRVNCATQWLAGSFTRAGAAVWKFIASLPTYETSTHGSYAALLDSSQPVSDDDLSPQARDRRDWLKLYTDFIVAGKPGTLRDGFQWSQYGQADYGKGVFLWNETFKFMISDLDVGDRCDFQREHRDVFLV